MRKNLVVFLVAVLVCAFSLSVFAADFKDVDDAHWGSTAINRWEEEGVVKGDKNGDFRPDDNITRAEFVTMLVRLFEPEEKADLSGYKDVNKNAWYYDALSRAVALGAIQGYDANTMAPDAYITRQEAMVILNRVINLAHSSDANARKFVDANAIANWAIEAIAAFTENGFISGYEDGSLQPEGNITRAESAQLLNKTVGKIIKTSGEYDLTDVEGVVIVKADNVTIKNADGNKIVAVDEKSVDTLKVNGEKAEDVTVVNEEEKKDDEKKDEEKTSGGSSGTVTTPTITITESGEYYTFKKTGAVADGKRIKFVVGTETVATETLSASTYSSILDTILAKLDEDKLAKTLATNYKDNALVKKIADKIWAEITGDARTSAAAAGDADNRYEAMYEVYRALKTAGVDVVAKAKSAINYETDISAALGLLK